MKNIRKIANENRANKRMHGRRKRAYSCFLFIGTVVSLTNILSFIPMDSGTAGGIGFLLLIPLSIVSLVVFVVGIILSVMIWEDRILLVLSGLSLLFIVELATEFGSTVFYSGSLLFYGVVMFFLTVRWFLVHGKRETKM